MNNTENKIFIGGLAPMTTQDTLFQYFSQFGELSECKLVMDKNTGQSKGYAFIFFKDLADAQRAVEGGSAVIDGKRCNCNLASTHNPTNQQAQGNVEVPTEIKKVFVGGIGPNTTRDTVLNAFSQFGEVQECKVIVDQNTGFSKGYGFVEFLSPISAQKATASGFISIDGKNCNCNLAFNDKGDKTVDQGECKVFVGGLAPTVTSESLTVAMSPYGKVDSAKVVVDKVTQASKGFGFVEFASSKSASRAVKTGFVLIEGQTCNCNIASQGANNNNNNNNTNTMGMSMGFGQMAMPYAMPYAMPTMGFQPEPLGVDGLAYIKEQLYTVIQGSTSAQVLFANTRMLLNSLEGMYGGGDAMTMQQPYAYANPTANLSLLKRPFGQQAGMEAADGKNKKSKPNDAQAWTPYTTGVTNFQQSQFDMTGGYRR